MPTIKESCREIYNSTYNAEKERLYQEAITASRSGVVSDEKEHKIETEAQKEAIKQAKRGHNLAAIRLMKSLRERGCPGFLVGASGCALCSPCALNNGES